MLDAALPIELMQGSNPAQSLADYLGLQTRRGWAKSAYDLEPPVNLDRISNLIAEKLAGYSDLQFYKLGVIWNSNETPERMANFRKQTGVDPAAILRRPVISDGAQPKDWAALFKQVLAFGWDAAAASRSARSLVWFSHDEYIESTPPSLIRRI